MKIAPSSQAAKRHQRNAKQMAAAKRHSVAVPAPKILAGMEPVHRRAAGIDIGSTENYVAIPSEGLAQGQSGVRVFGTFTGDHAALVEWLRANEITTVAMEATGVYWLSLYDQLEAAGIEVYLVDPHAVKAVPGRKSDWLDCQWLQKLHTYGLLRRAFRPDPPIRRLRVLTRQRAELVLCGVAHQEHMEKALVLMNLRLSQVVSDLIGETGLRIIRAILEGERDPKRLVELRDRRCSKSTVREMEAALVGSYDQEQLFILRQSLDGWEFYQRQIAACDQRIEQVLAVIPKAAAAPPRPIPPKPMPLAAEPTPKDKPWDRGHNAPTVDFTQALLRICGVNLMRVCGCNLLSVLMLIGEIGVDMSKWRNARAFCSWLGLCPATNISGGKVLSRRTRRVKNRAKTLLRLMAWAAGKTDTWLGHYYRRLRARKGPSKALTATARKLACIIYHMLKYQDDFVLLDKDQYDERAKVARLRRLKKEAQALGMDLVAREELPEPKT
jgi:transposase